MEHFHHRPVGAGASYAPAPWQATWFFPAMICLSSLLWPFAISAAPLLSGANRSAGQFQFQISGESNTAYIVEASTNLQSWTPVLTNSDAGATHSIMVSATDDHKCYRAAIATPIF